MIEIYIEHNPYKPSTKILIDNELVKDNSSLNYKSRPFQEWVEGLPATLRDECADDEFHITFHGTILDFEDLQSVALAAEGDGIKITCVHEPAKEVKDKEAAIDAIFQEIAENQYFDELKSPDVLKAFEIAKGKEFPVNVIATMSSGKSTLINALLGQKLMPAMQEACTATITELHDNDGDHFVATAYDAGNLKLSFIDPLNLSAMEVLNKDPKVSKVVAQGNIPFVSSEDVSLVLVDTPGPNNARNDEHRAATFRMLAESSKPLVLYVLNATQLAINDDNALLTEVAESMKVGGKQSKDRYIFVLNKLDSFKAGEDDINSVIQNARTYLADKGIENPNIYPASALTALEIRSDFKDVDLKNIDPANYQKSAFLATMARISNLNENLHLDEYAPLTPSVNSQIVMQLAAAREPGDMKQEALIHSGIKSIEAAIRVYVDKYAKTAKIRGIVETFAKKLESQKSFERTRKQIAESQERKAEIRAKIEVIKGKIDDAKAAKSFNETIDKLDFSKDVATKTGKIIEKAQASVREQIEAVGERKLSKTEAEGICAGFTNYAKNLQAKVCVDIENEVNRFIKEQCDQLTAAYVERLQSFAKDVNLGELQIDPVKILSGEIESANRIAAIINSATDTESVKVGEEWIENTSKKWYKPWTWFKEKGHWRSVYEDREFVDGKKLADAFFTPVRENLYQNQRDINESTKKQVNKIKKEFKERFVELDRALKKKLAELEQCASDENTQDEIIRQTTERLNWLTDIQNRVNAILEI